MPTLERGCVGVLDITHVGEDIRPMSKILQALQMASRGNGAVGSNPSDVGAVKLYPPPAGEQIAEFEDLANALIHLVSDATDSAIVVFSSTNRGEGASYVSFNCARCLAGMLGGEVAWVDANFRSPHLALKASPLSLGELLECPSNVFDFDVKGDGLTLIGLGDSQADLMKYIKGPAYVRLLDNLKKRFLFTIIDAPPILDGVELGHLAKNTKGLVLVVESKRLKHEIVKHGLEKIAGQNVTLLGTVLNKRQFQLPEFFYRRV